MTATTAKRHLRSMLGSFTAGSVLHLLGEVFEELVEDARRRNDELRHRQCREVQATLVVVGMGVDAAFPR
jgi:N-acetylmuramic acid 6-phosphate (MurNAc-6-P) etherase